MQVHADVRTSLTGHFLMAAAMQVRSAEEIETHPPAELTEDDQIEHRGLVVGAIMQSTAALECEIWEVVAYGPGHHLGSDRTDGIARDFLAPIADVIDRQKLLERYWMVLHLSTRHPSTGVSNPGMMHILSCACATSSSITSHDGDRNLMEQSSSALWRTKDTTLHPLSRTRAQTSSHADALVQLALHGLPDRTSRF